MKKRSVYSIAELKHTLSPRERLLISGVSTLSDKDLIVLLLGSGNRGKSVYTLSGEVLACIDNPDLTGVEGRLKAICGMGPAKTSVITAALELGRRVFKPAHGKVSSPEQAYAAVRHYADRDQECFITILLNGAHEVIAVKLITLGILNRAIVHPREVFAPAIRANSAAVIIAHNHPSGNLDPSSEDNDVTKRLRDAGTLLGIDVLDHIIFSKSGYYSFMEQGCIKI